MTSVDSTKARATDDDDAIGDVGDDNPVTSLPRHLRLVDQVGSPGSPEPPTGSDPRDELAALLFLPERSNDAHGPISPLGGSGKRNGSGSNIDDVVDKDPECPTDVVEGNGEEATGDPWLDPASRLARLCPSAIRLSDVELEHIDWIWTGRLARKKVHICDGDPGRGKSTIAIDWAARMSSGAPFPQERPTEPRNVVIMSFEDGLADTIKPRVEAAGGDSDRIFSLTEKADGTPITIPAHLYDLETLIKEVDAALVIIDPLTAALSPNISMNNDQEVRQALMPLKRVAEETGAAIVLVRHLNKKSDSSALHRGGGSIAISGVARIGLLVAQHPDDPELRVLATVKSNIGQFSPSLVFKLEPGDNNEVARVVYLGEESFTADDLVAATPSTQRPSKVDEAAD